MVLLNQNYSEAWGQIYSFIGAYEVANGYFRRSIRMTPNNIITYVALSQHYIMQGKYEESLSVVDTVCTINPESYECISGYAQAYMGLKEYDKALEYLNKVELSEQFSMLQKGGNFVNQINVYHLLGNSEKVKELSQLGISFLKGIEIPIVHYSLFTIYAAIGETAQALFHLKKANPLLRQFGYHDYLENNTPESLSNNEEFIEIVNQLKEEIRIIREQVFAMEAAGEL